MRKNIAWVGKLAAWFLQLRVYRRIILADNTVTLLMFFVMFPGRKRMGDLLASRPFDYECSNRSNYSGRMILLHAPQREA
jgi:hypothetical protein